MFHRFGSIPLWPNRDVLIRNMPPKFKEEFPTTFLIIDGTEIKVQRPTSLQFQGQCYSDYTSCNTLKALIGVDLRGSVTFISTLFSSSISDNEICRQSSLFDCFKGLVDNEKLHIGDVIMADKGFTIEKDLEKIGLQLNIPPFAPSQGQMSQGDVQKTKVIAAHRVHVERAISRIKKF